MSWLPLQGLADWLLTFAIHSTCILGLALVVSLLLGQRWLVWQERLLRFSLWAALASSSAQMLFATTPLPLSLSVSEPAPAAADVVAPSAFAPAPLAATPAENVVAAPWPVAAWMVGGAFSMALLGGIWLLRAQLRLRRLLRGREPETDGRTLALAAEAARSLGLRQSPHVSRSDEILTPIAFGCLRPEICLPRRAGSLADAELRAMLTHEIAHLRRLDPIWMWIAAGIHAVFPWQVLLLAARRRWSHLVELRCDAIAAGQTSPTAVARCLLDVAEWLAPPARARAIAPVAALGMAARPSALRHRVETALHRGAAGRLRRGWSIGFGSASLSALTFAAPGVSPGASSAATAADLQGAEPAAVAFDESPLASPLRSTLALLEAEHAELEQELVRLRVRAAGHPRSLTIGPLVAEIAQRLTVVDRSCRRIRALIDRRASRESLPKSR